MEMGITLDGASDACGNDMGLKLHVHSLQSGVYVEARMGPMQKRERQLARFAAAGLRCGCGAGTAFSAAWRKKLNFCA